MIKHVYIHILTYSLILQSKLILEYQSWEMSEDNWILIKDPEVVQLSGTVIQSFYKDCLCSEQTGQSQQCLM